MTIYFEGNLGTRGQPMLFVGKETRREHQVLVYTLVILLHIVLVSSLPDETGGFEKDQVSAHSLILCRL